MTCKHAEPPDSSRFQLITGTTCQYLATITAAGAEGAITKLKNFKFKMCKRLNAVCRPSQHKESCMGAKCGSNTQQKKPKGTTMQ